MKSCGWQRIKHNAAIAIKRRFQQVFVTDTLDVIAKFGDVIDFGNGKDWKIGIPKFIDGRFTHIITESGSGSTAEIHLKNDRLMQNPLNKYDADRDGKTQPVDALVGLIPLTLS